VVQQAFHDLGHALVYSPLVEGRQLCWRTSYDANQLQSTHAASTDSTSLECQDVVFDTNKLFSCTVENSNVLVHGAGGRGYGLASTVITSGCYTWKASTRVLPVQGLPSILIGR
jgi:hypothetical protein